MAPSCSLMAPKDSRLVRWCRAGSDDRVFRAARHSGAACAAGDCGGIPRGTLSVARSAWSPCSVRHRRQHDCRGTFSASTEWILYELVRNRERRRHRVSPFGSRHLCCDHCSRVRRLVSRSAAYAQVGGARIEPQRPHRRRRRNGRSIDLRTAQYTLHREVMGVDRCPISKEVLIYRRPYIRATTGCLAVEYRRTAPRMSASFII